MVLPVILGIVGATLFGILFGTTHTETGREVVEKLNIISPEAFCGSFLSPSWDLCKPPDGPTVLQHPDRFGATNFAVPCVDNVLTGHLADTIVASIDNTSSFYTAPDASYFCGGNESNRQYYQTRPASDVVTLVSTQEEDKSQDDLLASALPESKPELSTYLVFQGDVVSWLAFYGMAAFATSIFCLSVCLNIYLFWDLSHWKYVGAALVDKVKTLEASIAQGDAGQAPGLMSIIDDLQKRVLELERCITITTAQSACWKVRASDLSHKTGLLVLRCWSKTVKYSILTRHVSAIEDELQQEQSAKSSLSREVSTLNQKLQQETFANKALQKRLTNAKDQLHDEKSKHDNHIEQAAENKQQIDNLPAKNLDLTAGTSRDKKEIENQKSEARRLALQASQDKQVIRQQNSQIQSGKDKVSTIEEELQEEKRKKETLTNEKALIQEELRNQTVNNKALSDQVIRLEKKNHEQKSLVESRTRDVSTKENELRRLKSATAATVKEETKDLTAKNESLAQKVSVLETNLKEQKAKAQSASEESTTKQRELLEKTSKIQNLDMKLSAAELELNEQKSKDKAQKEELFTKHEELRKESAKVESLKKKISENETELKTQTSQVKSLTGQVVGVEKNFQVEKARNETLDKTVARQKDHLNHQTATFKTRWSQQSADHARIMREKNSELADANNRMAEASNKLENVKASLSDMTNELADTKHRYAHEVSALQQAAADKSVMIVDDHTDGDVTDDEDPTTEDATHEDTTQVDLLETASKDVSSKHQADNQIAEAQKEKKNRSHRGRGGPKTLHFQLFPYPHYEIATMKKQQLILPFPTKQTRAANLQLSLKATGGLEDQAKSVFKDNASTPEKDEDHVLVNNDTMKRAERKSADVNSASTSASSGTVDAVVESDESSPASASKSTPRTLPSTESPSQKSPPASKQDTHQTRVFSVQDSAATVINDRSGTNFVPRAPLPPIERQEGDTTAYVYPDNPEYNLLVSQGQHSGFPNTPSPYHPASGQHVFGHSSQPPSNAVVFNQQSLPTVTQATTQQTELPDFIFHLPSSPIQSKAGSQSHPRITLPDHYVKAAGGPSRFAAPDPPLAKGESPLGNSRKESTRLLNQYRRQNGAERYRLARKAARGEFKGEYNPAQGPSHRVGNFNTAGPSQLQAHTVAPTLSNSPLFVSTGPRLNGQAPSTQSQSASPPSQQVPQKKEAFKSEAGLTESIYASPSVQLGKNEKEHLKPNALLTDSKSTSPSVQPAKRVTKEESKPVSGLNDSMYASLPTQKAKVEETKVEKIKEEMTKEQKLKEVTTKEQMRKKRDEKGHNEMMGSRWA